MSYSYDRRRGVVADDPTAAKAAKPKPIVPRQEQDDAIKHLTQVQYLMKEWVIRSNPDFALGHEYGASHETYQKMSKIRDEFDALVEKIRHLHPSGV